jgi:hypothetical protein
MLAERAGKHPRVHDYDRYAKLPNNLIIKSLLEWRRGNQSFVSGFGKDGKKHVGGTCIWLFS